MRSNFIHKLTIYLSRKVNNRENQHEGVYSVCKRYLGIFLNDPSVDCDKLRKNKSCFRKCKMSKIQKFSLCLEFAP